MTYEITIVVAEGLTKIPVICVGSCTARFATWHIKHIESIHS